MPDKQDIPVLERIDNNMSKLLKIIGNSSIAKPVNAIPYNSGPTQIATALSTRPANVNDYTVKIDVYQHNSNIPISQMQLINDGPGKIYFVQATSNKMGWSGQEETINVGDSRELFNVYEVRMRTDIPLTTYRLIEGSLKTGSFARSYKANTEIRPTVQSNEVIKTFSLTVDTSPALVPGTLLPAIYAGPSFHAPIAAGVTEPLVDISTGLDMPYTIPQGYILEAFSSLGNFTRNWTLRGYYEVPAGTGIYNHTFVIPISARGNVNWVLNINAISTEVLDPTGAPAGGRGVVFTVTNDDAADTMTGEFDIIMILRKVS